MRRLCLFSLLMILANAGCTLLPEKQTAPVVAPPLQEAAPAPVKPDDITPANARQKLRDLQRELDRDIEGDDPR